MANPPHRYMLFSAGGRRYAVDVDAVDEISGMLPEYPVPRAPRFLRGVVNIHGKLAAVVDLSMFLGRGPTRKGNTLLLFRMAGSALAIVAEQTERLCFAEEVLAVEPAEGEPGGVNLQFDDGSAVLLSLEQLMASLEKALSA